MPRTHALGVIDYGMASTRVSRPAHSGIYAIRNAVTGDFYIGSSVNMRHRWQSHHCDLKKGRHGNERLQRAWDKYGADAFRFVEVARIPTGELWPTESRLLARLAHRADCYNLARVAGAPQTGRVVSDETRRKISAANTGRRFTEEHRAKIAAAGRKRALTPEQIERLRQANLGRKPTPETIEKRRAASLGRKLPPRSEAHRAKLSAAHKGRKPSEQTRAKMSEAQRRRPPITEETRAKLRAAAIGHVVSAETRAKIAATRRARFGRRVE